MTRDTWRGPGSPLSSCTPASSSTVSGALEQVARRGRHEDLIRLGERHDPSGGVDGEAASFGADELDLAGMDADADGQPERADRADHRNATADGSSRPIEHGQEPVAGRRHLATAVRVERVPQHPVVVDQQVTPGGVADAMEGRRRVDDVREQDRGQDRLTGPLRRHAKGSGARPLERGPRLVPDDPCIMAGRNLVHRVRRDVDLLPVVHHDVHVAGDRVAEMVELAPRGACDRRHVRRPAPARLVHGTTDGRLADVHHAGVAMRKVAHLVGRGEALEVEPWHVTTLRGRGRPAPATATCATLPP